MLLGRPAPPVWGSEYGTRQAANSYKDSSIIQSCLFLSSHTLDISSYNYLAKLSKGREEGQWEKLIAGKDRLFHRYLYWVNTAPAAPICFPQSVASLAKVHFWDLHFDLCPFYCSKDLCLLRLFSLCVSSVWWLGIANYQQAQLSQLNNQLSVL